MLVAYGFGMSLLALVAMWIVAEFRWSRPIRIALGITSIIVIGLVASVTGGLRHYYANINHRESVRLINDLLEAERHAELKEVLSGFAGRANDTSSLGTATQLRQELIDAVSQVEAGD